MKIRDSRRCLMRCLSELEIGCDYFMRRLNKLEISAIIKRGTQSDLISK